jgi:hypothetical protein
MQEMRKAGVCTSFFGGSGWRGVWLAVVLCVAGVARAALIQWGDGDGTTNIISSAVWNNLQAAITNAGNNPATPGIVRLSGDFTRTAGDTTVGSLIFSNANVTLSGGWDATFTTQSGRSILNVNGQDSAGNKYRVLYISATNVLVQNVVVTNGFTRGVYQVSSSPGGGIYIDGNGNGVTLQNLVVVNNTCLEKYCGQNGGGIAVANAVGVRVSDCEVRNNSAQDRGGGIYIGHTITPTVPTIIERCTIVSNKTIQSNGAYNNNYGGGVDVSGSGTSGSANIVLANCTILWNQSRYGCGINLSGYAGGSKATVFGCLIASNSWNSSAANPGDGNGVSFSEWHTTAARLVNCTVADNVQAASPGQAGLYVKVSNYSAERANIINSITRSNDAGWRVDRVYGSGRMYAAFQHSTVQEPKFIEMDSLENNLTNTTLAGAVSTTGNTTPAYQGLDATGGVTQAIQQNIEGSPMFLGSGAAPYQLTAASANALDNGVLKTDGRGFKYLDIDFSNTYTTNTDIIVAGTAPSGGPHLVYTTDLLGNPRVNGSGIDRGAYEMRTLGYSSATFYESVPLNDGSISNSLTLTLSGDTFNAAVSEELVGSGKVTTSNVPVGLTLAATCLSSTQVVLSLSGNAANHTAGDSILNLAANFQNSAFTGNNAATINGAARNNLAVMFYGASANRSLSYSLTNFTEAAANDGTIANTLVVTLSGDTFNASPGVTVGNAPAGLTPVVTKLTDLTVSIALTGAATGHRTANNVTNLTVTFADSAFSGGNAAAVTNYLRSDLQVIFIDPVVSYVSDTFNEGAPYDGTIGNTLTLTLAGDTFNATNGEDLVTGGKLVPSNVPSGLTAVVTRVNAQTVTAALTGKASAHNATNSVANLTFAFQNAAFAAGAAAAVSNNSKADLKVNFVDPVLWYSGTTFSESYTMPGIIANTLMVSLAGDAFNSATNQNLIGAGKVTVANVPAGLTAVLTTLSATQAVLALTGTAAPNEATNSVTNLTVTCLATAFAGNNAVVVTNSVTNLAVSFISPLDWYVGPTGSDTNSGSLAAPFATVARAVTVAQAAANDVIHILPGTYTQNSITVNKVVTLAGSNSGSTILQAAAAPFTTNVNVLSISQVAFVRNLTIQYGNTPGNGGGVNVGGGVDAYFDGCAFVSNACTSAGIYSGGGALSAGENVGGTVFLQNCRFIGNRSAADGGALRAWQPGIWVSNCTFTANWAARDGGAIGKMSGGGAVLLYDSSFLGNTAGTNAGAVICPVVLTMAGCTFAGNAAQQGGAVISVYQTPLIMGCTFYGNSATNEGGAIFNNNNNGVLAYNSTFYLNSAKTGGALRISQWSSGYTLYSCIVASNIATVDGPDISWANSGTRACYNCLIGNNTNSGLTAAYPAPDANTNYIGSATNSINPLLAPLANNGGKTWTCLPLPGSLAVDHGSNPLGLLWDQRGSPYVRAYAPRPNPQVPDVGAAEYGASLPVFGTSLYFR